jgi:hypothetical protein
MKYLVCFVGLQRRSTIPQKRHANICVHLPDVGNVAYINCRWSWVERKDCTESDGHGGPSRISQDGSQKIISMSGLILI